MIRDQGSGVVGLASAPLVASIVTGQQPFRQSEIDIAAKIFAPVGVMTVSASAATVHGAIRQWKLGRFVGQKSLISQCLRRLAAAAARTNGYGVIIPKHVPSLDIFRWYQPDTALRIYRFHCVIRARAPGRLLPAAFIALL